MCIETYVYIVSVAFQLAGSLILLKWFFGNEDNEIIKQYYPGTNVTDRDQDNNVILEKSKLRRIATEIYLNRTAIIYVILGFALSIFGDIDTENRWVILILSVSSSLVMLIVGILICKGISTVKYKTDKKLPYDSVVHIADTSATIQEIDDLFD